MEPLTLTDEELTAAVQRDDALAVTRALAGSGVEAAKKPGLLHTAAEANAAEVIAVLVAAGAHLGALDDDLQSPLHAAVANGNFDAADVLTEVMPCAQLLLADK